MMQITRTFLDDIPAVIYEALQELEIMPHIKGYDTSAYAILLLVESPELIHSVTKELYPKVAKAFNSTPSRVERNIRHLIDCIPGDLDDKVIQRYLGGVGYHKLLIEGKVSNSFFLSALARSLRRQILDSDK